MFLEVEMQGSILIPPNQLVRRSSQGRNSSLNGKLYHQKVIQWAWVFCRCHFWGKIGEGRIWDLTGDILFPVAFKDTIPTTIPTVTMKNPEHCWCVMSNKALTDISRAQTSWGSKYSPMSPTKMWKTDWGCQNLQEAKNQKVKILLRQKQKIWRTNANWSCELQTRSWPGQIWMRSGVCWHLKKDKILIGPNDV